MADIDQIIAGGAGASSRADFSGIPKLLDSYWAGLDQRAKNDLRDAFKPTADNPNGIPMKDGQPDVGAMAKTFFQKGDFASGTALLGQAQNATERLDYARDGEPRQQPQSRMPVTDAPSPSRSIQGQVAPELSKGGVQAQGGGQDQPTVMKILAQHVPNDQLGAASASIMRQLADVAPGLSATDPIDINDPRISNVLRPAVAQIKRMGLGQVQPPQPGDGQPQAPQMAQAPQGFQPSPAQVAAQNDPELKRLRYRAGSPDKAVAESARMELKTKLEGQQPTTEMKHATAMGIPLKESLDRTDENTTQRDILTKSIIPRIDKSQEKAMAARDDIDTLHKARSELDRPGGIFSGAFAGDKLSLAKAAELFGISNADKVANTEAFSSAAGQRVASLIKAFGSGTAISDGDRKFTEAIAGGRITLDEKSIRRILDIGEKADRLIIERHNVFADKAVAANDGLKVARDTFIVEHPGQYKKPDTAAFSAFSAARSAIDKGAPRDAVMKRLRENGHDPSGL